MSKTIKIPDIAQWEETDSELAKYNIQSLSTLIKNQEEQLKTNDLMINELINRINKAIEYIENEDIDICTIRYNDIYDTKKELLNILKGEDNE